jgi:hypothetical protein
MGIALGLAATSPAVATTVEIGSPPGIPFTATAVGGGGNVSFANTGVIGGPTATSPFAGTLISWRFSGGSGGPFRLRVIRPNADGTFTGAGSSPPVTPTSTASTPAFPTSLPVLSGDLIGFDPTNGLDTMGLSTGMAGSGLVTWSPRLADGQTRVPSGPVFNGEFIYSAILRYCRVPKMLGATLKKAKRALRQLDCTIGKVKVKGKGKGGKPRVTKQSQPARTAVSDTLPIRITLKRPN